MKEKLTFFFKNHKKLVLVSVVAICCILLLIGGIILYSSMRNKKQEQDLSEFFDEYKQMHITTEHHRMMYYTKRVSVNPNDVIDIRYMDMDDAEKVLKEYHETGRENKDIILIGFRNNDQSYIEFSSGSEGVTVEVTFSDKIVKRENIIDTNDTLKALRIYWTLMSS